MDHPVLDRFEQAKKYDPQGYNCIGAAYFLLGLDGDKEQYKKPARLEEQDNRIMRVDELVEADMIGVELTYDVGYIHHLAVIHPLDRTKILHRHTVDAEIKEDSIDWILWFNTYTSKYRTVFLSVDTSGFLSTSLPAILTGHGT